MIRTGLQMFSTLLTVNPRIFSWSDYAVVIINPRNSSLFLAFVTCSFQDSWKALLFLWTLWDQGTMHTQAQQRQIQTVDHSVVPNSCPGPVIRSIWHWPTPEFLPRGPRNNTPSCQLQTASEQDLIHFTSGECKGIPLYSHQNLLGKFHLAWSVPS